MGIRNSSLTRVQPVFDALYKSDPSGRSWLLPLIQLGNQSGAFLSEIDLGELSGPPEYEFPAPPPREFLRYLLKNPSKLLIPPEQIWKKWHPATQAKRRAFLAGDELVQQEGLEALGTAPYLRQKPWWRLEGATAVDCALFTPKLALFIEGKRTEDGPSRRVTWWERRNQVIRSAECVAEFASVTGRTFGFVLVVAEEELCRPGTERARRLEAITDTLIIAESLPHLSMERRGKVMAGYLGWTTWQAILRYANLNSSILTDVLSGES